MERGDRLNGELGLKLYDIFVRYSCLRTEERKEIVYRTGDGRRTVSIKNPVSSLYSWKLFLYCLWKAEEVEELEEGVRAYVSREVISQILRKPGITLREVKRYLEPLRYTHYDVEEMSGDIVNYYDFGLLLKVEGWEKLQGGYGRLKLLIDKAFYQFCLESRLFLYMVFVEELQSVYAVNLFTFLTAHSDGRVFREEVLFDKAGIPEDMELFNKRLYLKRALNSLVSAGFLKGFSCDAQNRKWILERYDAASLRVITLEKLKALEEELKFFSERQREKERERKRKQRQKNKAPKPEIMF